MTRGLMPDLQWYDLDALDGEDSAQLIFNRSRHHTAAQLTNSTGTVQV